MCKRCGWWWLLLLPVVGALLLLLKWWREWAAEIERETEERQDRFEIELDIPSDTPPRASELADDLTAIEGIGPKIAEVLRHAGIATYGALSESGAERLKEVLQRAGIRLAYPETWPEQAALAAAGDWDGLRSLQSQLDRGRRR